MIAKILTKFFGSAWKLKLLCIKTKNPRLKKILITIYNLHQDEHGSAIAWNSQFQGEPCFPHGMNSIFISGGAKIGRNCVIFQQVTIGSNTFYDSKGIGSPTLGDNCYVGAGAKIIGGVRIGNNVRIGANAVVHKDIPDNSIVVAGEQRVITKEEVLDNRYYSFRGRWVYFENSNWLPVDDAQVVAKLNSIWC